MKTIEVELVPPEPDKEHGRLYWLCANVLKYFKNFLLRHKKVLWSIVGVLVFIFIIMRNLWQPYILYVRIHLLEIVSFCLVMWGIWKLFRMKRWKLLLVAIPTVALAIWSVTYLDFSPQEYTSLWIRHRNLGAEELDELPTTDHERIHPLHSIRVLGKEAMTEVEQVSDPDLVRIGNSYSWVMAIEPAYPIPRMMGNVSQIVMIPATAPSPNFSKENRETVSFGVGEGLMLGKNSVTATIRSFGLLRYFFYQPDDVRYLKDDKGAWVQVISLIKWNGFFFPRAEFGGVQIIRQGDTGVIAEILRLIVGEGEWIRPRDVEKHPYLLGQNLVPYKVSRYAAESLRFQKGFMAPFPGYHKGDIRIPDMPGDMNDQPFTVFFRFKEGSGKASKLYHYFALEPYDREKQGLNTSLFYPADGVGKIYVYQHYLKNDALTGVSSIAAKVMESRKQYDWKQNRPAEQRPYIKVIGGKTRFFWLTTVVTYKGEGGKAGDFIAGSTPDVVLTDALYKVVVWVDSRNPDSWVPKLETELKHVWKQ